MYQFIIRVLIKLCVSYVNHFFCKSEEKIRRYHLKFRENMSYMTVFLSLHRHKISQGMYMFGLERTDITR